MARHSAPGWDLPARARPKLSHPLVLTVAMCQGTVPGPEDVAVTTACGNPALEQKLSQCREWAVGEEM